jgi:hypothetical protein
VVDPATCEFPEEHFAVRDGRLVMIKGGEKTIVCRLPMPAEPGAVTSMVTRGFESLGASFITPMAVWHAPNGRRRQVAHCYFNGRPKKPATECVSDLVQTSVGFDGGGEMVVEIRYVASGKELPFDKFGITEVEIGYQLRE